MSSGWRSACAMDWYCGEASVNGRMTLMGESGFLGNTSELPANACNATGRDCDLANDELQA